MLSLLEGDPSSFPEMIAPADEFMRWMYDTQVNPDGNLTPDEALARLQEILLDRVVGRRVRHSVADADGGPIPQLPRLVEIVQGQMQRISTACQRQSVSLLGDGLEEYQQRLERNRGQQLIGLRSGMEMLDDRLCGVRGFILLGAAPGVGKSVYCLQIAAGVCRHSVENDNDACVLYLSLDMDADDVKDRLFCYLASVDWKTYRLGSEQLRANADGPRFTDGHQRRLDEARRKITDWQLDRRLAIVGRDEQGELTATGIAGMARTLKERAGARHCLIIVDYLQLLSVPDDVGQRGDLEADKHRIRTVQQVLDASKGEHDRPRDAAIVITEARKPTTPTARYNWGTKAEDLMGCSRGAS